MALPFGTGLSPIQGEPNMGFGPIVKTKVTTATLTTGGGARTATIAELLGGIFVLNVDDAQTLTLPTAALLNAGVPGATSGTNGLGATTFRFIVINVGDAALTVAVGTGGSLVVGNSKSTVATIAALASKEFIIRVTGVLQAGDSADSYTVYSPGVVAASVA